MGWYLGEGLHSKQSKWCAIHEKQVESCWNTKGIWEEGTQRLIGISLFQNQPPSPSPNQAAVIVCYCKCKSSLYPTTAFLPGSRITQNLIVFGISHRSFCPWQLVYSLSSSVALGALGHCPPTRSSVIFQPWLSHHCRPGKWSAGSVLRSLHLEWTWQSYWVLREYPITDGPEIL